MKSFHRVTTVLALTSLLVCGALAQGKKMMAKAPKCMTCHMPTSMTKTKANPIAMHMPGGNKTYYCCSMCKMPKNMMGPAMAKKAMPKKPMAKKGK